MDGSSESVVGGAFFVAVIGVWSLVGIAVYVWYLWSLSRLFPKLGLPSAYGWIPVWNQWQLVQRGGLPGWMVLLGFVPGLNIVVVIVSIIAIYRLNAEHGKGAGFTVLGAFIAPLWAMLLANHIGDATYAAPRGTNAQPLTPPPGYPGAPAGAPQAPQPAGAYGTQLPAAPAAWQGLPPVAGYGAPHPGTAQPVAPGQPAQFADPHAYPAQPVAPAVYAPQPSFPQPVAPQPVAVTPVAPAASTPPVAPQQAAPAAWPADGAPVHAPSQTPEASPAPAAESPVNPPMTPPLTPPAAAASYAQTPPPSNGWGFSATTEGDYERLAAEGSARRGAAPLGEVAPERPFSWPAPYETIVQKDDAPLSLPEPEAAHHAGAQRDADAPVAVDSSAVNDAPVPVAAPASLEAATPDAVSAAPAIGAPAAVDPVAVEPVAVAPVAVEPVAVEPAALETPAVVPAVIPVLGEDPVPTIFETSRRVARSEAAADPAPAPASHAAADELPEDDHTVFVPRRARWALQLPDGETHELVGDDVVVGRKPTAAAGVSVMQINDPTRTMSKTHARMRRTGDTWTIEDLNSTNGVAVSDEIGEATQIGAGTQVAATEDLVIGTLEVKLVRIG